MPRPRPGVLALALAPLVFAAGGAAANVALPAVNPAARVIATPTTGAAATANALNDGVNANAPAGSVFIVPAQIPGAQTRPGSRGFGFDLGGVTTIESLDLSQYTGGSSRGPRARLADVVVHTAAGSFALTLPDQDDVTIPFATPAVTSWVMIETNSQHDGDDPAIGIDELAVNAASAALAPRRTNVAAGRLITFNGAGWSGAGDLTDNTLAGSATDLSTTRVSANPSAAGVSLDIDLGASQPVNALGLAENDYGASGGRRLAQDVRLQFSDDPTFSTVSATRDLALSNVPYQQEDFDPASGRYVRLTVLSRYANRDESLGITEVQLFAVPEPTGLGLLAASGILLMRRKKPSATEH